MQLKTIEFPSTVPAGVEGLEDEPDFVPSRHLQLESSRETHTLEEFGYSDEVISQCPGGIAVAGPFRVLSDEGAAVLLETSRRLQQFKSRSERIAAMVRFPAYRSKFIRELARSAEVAKFVGGRFASWMSPGNPPFSQEYNKAPYFDKFIEDLMEVINDYKGEEEIDEQNTTGGGASFNAGTGMGHFGSNITD